MTIKPYNIEEHPDHLEVLKTWRDPWIKNIFDTKQMTVDDKQQCKTAINALYKAANLTLPKQVVFVSSVFTLISAAGLAIAILYLQKERGYKLPKKCNIDNETIRAVLQVLGNPEIELSNTSKKTAYSFTKHIKHETRIKELDKELGLDGLGIDCARKTWRMWQGGNQESWGCAFYSFFRDVAHLDKTHNIDYNTFSYWETLCKLSGPRMVHEEFCMISEKPTEIHYDNEYRLHNLNGPAIKYSDGSALWSVHNVMVPAWIIERKQDITAEKINQETNIEVRRIMLQIFGEERYLKEGNYKVLHTDIDNTGQLRRLLAIDNGSDERILMVEVVNSSKELDGSYKTYYLRVDPEVRTSFPGIYGSKALDEAVAKCRDLSREEMIQQGYLGLPQTFTCHNAVASTFGLTGEEYGLPGQTRQGDVLVIMKTGISSARKFRES